MKMITISILIIIILSIAWLLEYIYFPAEQFSPAIKQGVFGKVTLFEGNCMPGAGGCKESRVSRTIYIREPITMGLLKNVSLYWENTTNLIKQIKSNAEGFYEVDLPPGNYSILVDDNGKEYCNSFGQNGEVCQIILVNGIKEYNIEINHAAW